MSHLQNKMNSGETENPTPHDHYREALVKTVVDIENLIRELTCNIVNLAMNGDFAEIDALFEDGDVMRLDVVDFENADDQNVQRLIKLFHLLCETANSTRNINAISEKETDDYDDLPF